MKYYKLLDEEFIGVVNSSDFVRENPNNGWLLTSNENLGQFVQFENKLYRDFWMQPIPNSTQTYIRVEITEITEEEYNTLKKAIDNDEPIIIDDDDEDEPVVIPVEEDDPDYTLEFMRASKLKEMSLACRKAIENGFDMELADGIQHFSLTVQDQLNLMSLSAMAQTQALIPYHADGETCVFYTAEEINQIVDVANNLKIYHTTYYNALKGYINSLNTLEALDTIYYGIEIPEEYKTDVLRVIE